MLHLRVYNEYVAGLNTWLMSSFPEEKELLFLGYNSILQLCSISQWNDKKWLSYRKYIVGIQGFIDIALGTIKYKHVNNMKDIVGHLLPDLYHDNKP